MLTKSLREVSYNQPLTRVCLVLSISLEYTQLASVDKLRAFQPHPSVVVCRGDIFLAYSQLTSWGDIFVHSKYKERINKCIWTWEILDVGYFDKICILYLQEGTTSIRGFVTSIRGFVRLCFCVSIPKVFFSCNEQLKK